ncbi:MAG: GAF domain-containing protein [Chloroflexi bacterium]|nr:GAF domain-containing protein [Chloroflexota bacterium]
MDNVKALVPVPSLAKIRDRLAPGAVVLYQIIALLVFMAVPFLAFSWLQKPFLGGLVNSSLVFRQVTPTTSGAWDTYGQGVKPGDQLIQIGGQEVDSPDDLYRALESFSTGEIVQITILSGTEELTSLDVTLNNLPNSDRYYYLYLPYLVGLVYLGAGMWVFYLRREDAAARAFTLCSASGAILLGGLFDYLTTQRFTMLWTIALGTAGASLFQLAFVFPNKNRATLRFPFLEWFPYLPALGIALYSTQIISASNNPELLAQGLRAEIIFLTLGLLTLLFGISFRRFSSPSPIEREQTRIMLGSIFLSFGPLAAWGIEKLFAPSNSSLPVLLIILPLAFFPIAAAYSLLRYRLLNTDRILQQTVLYSLLTAIGGSGYALLVSGVSLIFGSLVDINNPIFVGALVFVFALLLNPLRMRLQSLVDSLFFRGQRVYRAQLESFKTEISQAVDLSAIIAYLRQFVSERFQPVRMHIFVHDPLTRFYTAWPDTSGKKTTDIRFPANSGIVKTLIRRQSSVFIDESFTFPLALHEDKTRLSLLGAQLFIALPGQQQLAGWLALGPRKIDETYSNQDLSFLNDLSRLAALEIERAQVLADKDRRVHEMNVLTRVAQGVNVTQAFDDILELIFAQTNQVLPTRDFNLTLYNSRNKTLSHAFYVEDNERIIERENTYVPSNQGLEKEVITSQRAIITEDYAQECRNRGVLYGREDIFGWMSVPLNAGAETIGAISIGSRDPAMVFTREQNNILQAIADQTSGAIVKAQLLEESEQRAHQLATLNEVSRSLTSTLEIDPLLNRILQSAVAILNCEAGSLLLLDEETGELVFEVTVGPVAEDLIGKRMEPGVGLVGEAVTSKESVIVNNVETSDQWFQQPDEQTGFITRGLLVVPMMVKDRVIGAIEVINKKDLNPLDSEDQEILTAFTGQASILVENARLYSLTDQKLASRVEELSVMQRIDRELNTSLDVSRAMQITLDWAFRQSDTTAALIGVIEEDELRIMASEGIPVDLGINTDELLPLKLPSLEAAKSSGLVQHMRADELQNGASLLDSAVSQIVIPIRREVEVIGLLLMESINADTYTEDVENFLVRLSDHAAIAISNAQLYNAVQQANLAKSDFVSFVSHELKTPMTSIKGYADLLSAGSVGEINEAQANFLATIRTNVSRMSTLVSDLADVSQIEAGRLHLEFSAIPINDAVQDVFNATQALMDEKSQALTFDIPDDLPAAWGDRNRISQVLTNIVSNAHKYTPEGGTITIRAQQADNEWDPQGAPKVVLISIIDSGIGIKEEDQEKIFQQYFRTEEGKDTAPGTGLGLNISRNLVEMQGGQIWFESEFGKGTTFHFTVPVAELEAV